MATRIEIFVCYAHQDEKLLEELEKYLSPLRRQGVIDVWHKGKIIPGREQTSDINNHLNTARVILLLISANFIDSDYCYGVEMERAMERHRQGDACVIPVILRPIHWEDAPFGQLQALPKNKKPLVSWSNQDEAFYDIAQGIRDAVQRLPPVGGVTPQPPIAPVTSQPSPAVTLPPPQSQPSQSPSTSPPPFGTRVRITELLEEGYRFVNAKNYREALDRFRQVLQLDPGNAVAHSISGYIQSELGDYRGAVRAYEQALLQNPKDVAAWIGKSRALNALGEYDKGLAACEQALRLDPNNVDALNNKGWAFLGLRKFEEVLTVCAQVIRIDAKNDIAYNNKGAALEGLRRLGDACLAYQQALQFNPGNAVARANFSRLC